jgi:transcriptional regulator with XRE-family HTH domain
MTDPDRILAEFTRAWEAGELPDPDAFLARAPASEQPALSDRIRAYLAVAPEPDYDDAAWARLTADPAARRAAELPLGAPEPWPSLLPRLRARAGLTWAEVARGLGVARPERAERYLVAMERGEHEPRRVTRRALDALGRVLGVPAEALAWTGGPAQPALLRAAPSAAPAAAAAPAPPPLEELELMADLATRDADDWDDADLLFLGGRDLT